MKKIILISSAIMLLTGCGETKLEIGGGEEEAGSDEYIECLGKPTSDEDLEAVIKACVEKYQPST